MNDGPVDRPIGIVARILAEKADRRPCRARAWCIDVDGHGGPCTEIARAKHAPANFGPTAATKRRF